MEQETDRKTRGSGPRAHGLDGRPLVLATHNAGKVREIGELLAPFGVEVRSAGSLGLAEPEETGLTFVDNALLKARLAAEATGLPALGDDSGVAVTALGGEPGIYTARWAGPSRDWGAAMRAVEARLEALGPGADREAFFVCALALAFPDGRTLAFEGRVRGDLVWPPRGERGTGFEPMFRPEGERLTYGEMDAAKRGAENHRARAFAQLVEEVFGL